MIEDRRKHDRLQSQARQNQAVASLGQIALSSDLSTLLDQTVRLLVRTLGCDFAEVLELEPSGESLVLRAATGWDHPPVGSAQVEARHDALPGFTLMAGEPIVIVDLRSERRFSGPPLLRDQGVVSGASVVILGQPRPFGVLGVYAASAHEFDGDDVHLLRAAANIIAAAARQQHAEQALRDSEERMRAVVNTLVDGIITIDERGIMESVNPAAERLFGYSAPELVGRNVNVLMPEPYRTEHDAYVANYLRTGQRRIIGIGREVVGRRRDGTVFPMDLAVSELQVGGRRMFTGVVRDITDRRQLEREILEAGAEEQRRIGQDLHDGLCQHLAGIAFATEVLTRKLTGRSAPETPGLQKVADLIDQAITQARDLARGLQPVTLEAGGLVAALEALAGTIEEMFHISCMFISDGPCLVHDNIVATHLYRIAQEAVSNAIKHGKARTVIIDLSCSSEELRLTVRDDGSGIAGRHDGASGNGRGMGIQSMAYRARIVGGTLLVRPGERGGTTVSCVVPRQELGARTTEKETHGQEEPGGRDAEKKGARRRRSSNRSRAARGADQ